MTACTGMSRPLSSWMTTSAMALRSLDEIETRGNVHAHTDGVCDDCLAGWWHPRRCWRRHRLECLAGEGVHELTVAWSPTCTESTSISSIMPSTSTLRGSTISITSVFRVTSSPFSTLTLATRPLQGATTSVDPSRLSAASEGDSGGDQLAFQQGRAPAGPAGQRGIAGPLPPESGTLERTRWPWLWLPRPMGSGFSRSCSLRSAHLFPAASSTRSAGPGRC